MKRAKEIEALLDRIVELANEKDHKKITKRATGICRKSSDLQFVNMPDSPIWGLINSHGKANKQLRIEAQGYALKMQDNVRWLFHELTARTASERDEGDFETLLTHNINYKDSVLEWVYQDEPDEALEIIKLASILMLLTGTKGVNRCLSCKSFFLINTEHNKKVCDSRCKQQLYRDKKLAEKEERKNKKREDLLNNNLNGGKK